MLQEPKSPLPPFAKGGNFPESFRKSPFEKGGFKNQQSEGIFGKGYNYDYPIRIGEPA